jgi:hypothetical protein
VSNLLPSPFAATNQYVEDSYYRDIAYHTAIHAADTVHGVHFFISR